MLVMATRPCERKCLTHLDFQTLTALLRNVLDVLSNVLAVLRNVLDVLHNDLGVL